LRVYNDSISACLVDAFPEHKWLPWKFTTAPNGFWDDLRNQRAFLDALKEEKGYTSMEEFYQLTGKDLVKAGGRTLPQFNRITPPHSHHSGLGIHLIQRYSRSVAATLMNVFPEHQWHVWKFKTLPRVLSSNIQLEAMNVVQSLADKLGIALPQPGLEAGAGMLDAWYRVSVDQIPARFHAIEGGLASILRCAYPDHPWSEESFALHRKRMASQLRLHSLMQRHLSAKGSLSSYKSIYIYELTIGNLGEEHVKIPSSRLDPIDQSKIRRQESEIDLYFGNLKLAIEYQGVQHYFDRFVFGETNVTSEVDVLKAVDCAMQQITLLEVPHWWDQRLDSVSKTLQSIRKDIEIR